MATPVPQFKNQGNLVPGGPTATLPFTVPADLSDTMLLVQLSSLATNALNQSNDYGSVIWNGMQPLTRICRIEILRGAGGSSPDSTTVELWGLLNPTPGTGNVVATTVDETSISRVIMQATVLSGVNQTTGWRGLVPNQGQSSSASVTVTTIGHDSLIWAAYSQWNGTGTMEAGVGITEHLMMGGLGGTDITGWAGSKPAPSPGGYIMDVSGGANGAEWVMAGIEILSSDGQEPPPQPSAGISSTSIIVISS
jgi:hypothetical protein